MNDLISRAEVVAHFQRIKEASETNGQYNEGFVDGVDYCISFISKLPSAEPKRGKWLMNSGRPCECSICHYEGNFTTMDNYCHHCGARMEE